MNMALAAFAVRTTGEIFNDAIKCRRDIAQSALVLNKCVPNRTTPMLKMLSDSHLKRTTKYTMANNIVPGENERSKKKKCAAALLICSSDGVGNL